MMNFDSLYDSLDAELDSLQAGLDGDIERAAASFGVAPPHGADVGVFSESPLVVPTSDLAGTKLAKVFQLVAEAGGFALAGDLSVPGVPAEARDLAAHYVRFNGVQYWPQMSARQKELALGAVIGGSIAGQEEDVVIQLEQAWEEQDFTWERLQSIWEAAQNDALEAVRSLMSHLLPGYDDQALNLLAGYLWATHEISVSGVIGSGYVSDPYPVIISEIDKLWASHDIEPVVVYVAQGQQTSPRGSVSAPDYPRISPAVQPPATGRGACVRPSDVILLLGFATSIGMGLGPR